MRAMTDFHVESHRGRKKPESVEEETNRFETLEGALACLIEDFNMTGLKAQRDNPKLL